MFRSRSQRVEKTSLDSDVGEKSKSFKATNVSLLCFALCPSGALPQSCKLTIGSDVVTYCGDIGSKGADGSCYCDKYSQIQSTNDACKDYKDVSLQTKVWVCVPFFYRRTRLFTFGSVRGRGERCSCVCVWWAREREKNRSAAISRSVENATRMAVEPLDQVESATVGRRAPSSETGKATTTTKKEEQDQLERWIVLNVEIADCLVHQSSRTVSSWTGF